MSVLMLYVHEMRKKKNILNGKIVGKFYGIL